jgi:hypothetical protein
MSAAAGIIFLVVVISIGPLGGWYFGRGKGWALEGAVLGLFLSFVGWLVVAMIPPKDGGWRPGS